MSSCSDQLESVCYISSNVSLRTTIMTSAIGCTSNRLIGIVQNNTFVSFQRLHWDSLFRCISLFLPRLPNPLFLPQLYLESAVQVYQDPAQMLNWGHTCWKYEPAETKKSSQERPYRREPSSKWPQDRYGIVCPPVCSVSIVCKKRLSFVVHFQGDLTEWDSEWLLGIIREWRLIGINTELRSETNASKQTSRNDHCSRHA